MVFAQHHEPAARLPKETRTLARMLVSLTEEAEAINLYERRMALKKAKSKRAMMQNTQKEELKRFCACAPAFPTIQ